MPALGQFVRGVCCDHRWMPVPVRAGEDHAEVCTTCGARCRRDATRTIVLYERPAPLMLAPQHKGN